MHIAQETPVVAQEPVEGAKPAEASSTPDKEPTSSEPPNASGSAESAESAESAGDSSDASKSVVTFDVKPWDDETDLEAMAAAVVAIEKEGLKWGDHTTLPLGFGIKKLRVVCVLDESKVDYESLKDEIEELEDYVQSCDISNISSVGLKFAE